MEIDDELGEEGQSLVIGDESSSVPSGRRSLGSSRGGGGLLSFLCYMFDNSSASKWIAVLVALIMLVATYHAGKGQGRSSYSNSAASSIDVSSGPNGIPVSVCIIRILLCFLFLYFITSFRREIERKEMHIQ